MLGARSKLGILTATRFGISLLLLGMVPGLGYGLPVGFNRPLAPLTYEEIESKHFYVYYDKSAPGEAQSIIRSLEGGREALHRWFKVQRSTKQPVIVSATTSNASFANFLTDAIEIQSLGRGGRDLAWHELVHSSMYRHLDNILGPAGSIMHLPWMPAWWIEGLAEALALSIGGSEQVGLEAYFSATGRWPSYAKLHSLYGKGDFGYIGYGVAGAFVSYLLRTYDGERLPQVLAHFADYSQPWWWPMTIVPFTNFMPMDRVLVEWTGKTGEELYAEYQGAATKQWRRRLPSNDWQRLTKLDDLPYQKDLYGIATDGQQSWRLYSRPDGKGFYEAPLGGTRSPARQLPLPNVPIHYTRFHGQHHVYLTSEVDDDLANRVRLHVSKDARKLGTPYYVTKSRIPFVFSTDTHVFWLEESGDRTGLCYKVLGKPTMKRRCPIAVRQPTSLVVIGTAANTLHLRQTEATLVGDREQLVRFDAKTMRMTAQPLKQGGKSLSYLYFSGKHHYLLAGHNKTRVRVIDAQGSCVADYQLPLHGAKLLMMDRAPHVALREPYGYRLIPLAGHLPSGKCEFLRGHRSPLTYAQMKPSVAFNTALDFASTWSEPDPLRADVVAELIAAAPPLDKALPHGLRASAFSQPRSAAWRGRSLFIFPWIGADGQGNTFGFRSVPLMDHMQNETVYFSALYGVESRFPDLALHLESSRFKHQIQARGFNRQTYNGIYGNDLLYYRETGAEVALGRYYPVTGLSVNYRLASAYFKPIIGPPEFAIAGQENKFAAGVAKSWQLGSYTLSQSLTGEVVPQAANDTWEYNKLGSATTLSLGIAALDRWATIALGVSGSRTRGAKRKYLREVYRPLRTYVPGDGEGINGANFTVVGDGFLTGAVYGDTQARSKLSFTMPLVPDFETLVGIFYLQRLDFSAFVNYGTAWTNQLRSADLILAHGYNLDLATDIKGVKVNLGLGVGQVVDHDWEVYFKFGFDTLIDIES